MSSTHSCSTSTSSSSSGIQPTQGGSTPPATRTSSTYSSATFDHPLYTPSSRTPPGSSTSSGSPTGILTPQSPSPKSISPRSGSGSSSRSPTGVLTPQSPSPTSTSPRSGSGSGSSSSSGSSHIPTPNIRDRIHIYLRYETQRFAISGSRTRGVSFQKVKRFAYTKLSRYQPGELVFTRVAAGAKPIEERQVFYEDGTEVEVFAKAIGG